MEFFTAYKDGTVIKVSRPDYLTGRDKEISLRAYEKLKGGFRDDDWSKEMDELFDQHIIMFKQVPKAAFKQYLKKKGNKFVVPGHLELGEL